jgi:uncharacterized radical SAM superfamily Fe-S cluster-containing enzyme
MTCEADVVAQTFSVCPVCLARIPAQRVLRDSDVYLEKTCPEHGFFSAILWRGGPDHDSWKRPKEPNHPRHPFMPVDKGCPYDCGPCEDHRQEPCCVLLEVTARCDLRCPVCFASAGDTGLQDPSLADIERWYRRMLEAGGPFNIQLSGGEPCLRDDLPEIIAKGKRLGFTYFQVNTNGLRIGEEPGYLARLKEAGLKVVYLQFDGTRGEIHRTLRGRDLMEAKRKAVQASKEAGLGVVLVPTIQPGVNGDDLGGIIRFALDHYPTVRSIHFQPLTYFGRYPCRPTDDLRITIPELLRGMEEQTGGLVHAADFQPKGSENSYCSFHATYVILPDGSLKLIKPQTTGCCCKPESAREGLMRSKAFVARNWPMPADGEEGVDNGSSSLGGWEDFLTRARTHLFSISGMAFQDAWNLDLELLQDCCIHIAAPDGRLIPFCAYNLTNMRGESLYRLK